MSYNKSILIGRITKDLELKQTPNGVAVTSFSIAVDRQFKSKSGEKQTDFIDIVAFRSTAEFITRYFSKGKAILIEGSIQTRSYTDKNGQNRRVWEIVADSAHFVESKNATGGGASMPTDAMAPASAPAYSSGSVEDFEDIDDDGDLPF